MNSLYKNGTRVPNNSTLYSEYGDISKFKYVFIKGDSGSQVCKEHTSIKTAEFNEFIQERCKGIVVFMTARVVFEREVIIGFTEEEDAILFKLTWG